MFQDSHPGGVWVRKDALEIDRRRYRSKVLRRVVLGWLVFWLIVGGVVWIW